MVEEALSTDPPAAETGEAAVAELQTIGLGNPVLGRAARDKPAGECSEIGELAVR